MLNQLVEMGKLTPAEAQKWIDAPIRVVEEPFPDLGSAPKWVDLVHDELVRELKAQGKEEAELDRIGGSVQRPSIRSCRPRPSARCRSACAPSTSG